LSVVLLLVAGFSKWAADLPVARQLFDFDIAPFGPLEERKLIQLHALRSIWDAAHAGGEAEQFIGEAIAAGGTYRDAVLWYVQRRLVAPYIFHEEHVGRVCRHVLHIGERSRLDGRPGVASVGEFLARCTLAAVVTLNYDMLVEYALGTRGLTTGGLVKC
jgi:hypothetical protein